MQTPDEQAQAQPTKVSDEIAAAPDAVAGSAPIARPDGRARRLAGAALARALPEALRRAHRVRAVAGGARQAREPRRAAGAEAASSTRSTWRRRCWCCRSRCCSPTARRACRSRLFTELRQVVFARVMARVSRRVTLQVFRHLHALSLRFHLARRTGGVARDVERGGTAISDLLDWTLYTIMPTALRSCWSPRCWSWAYDWGFALITLAHAGRPTSLFTVSITEWRTRYYRAAVEADTAGQRARGRFAAQLRDGQVLRQRGARGAPLRREPAAPGERAGDEPQDAGGAQPRADRDRRDRRHRDDVARGGGRGRRRDDRRRPGAGQRLPAAALGAAEHARHDVSRSEAGADQHRAPVRPARRTPGRAGPPRRDAAARRAAARRASRACASPTTRAAQILHDVDFDDPARRHAWRWSAIPAPASRRWRACCTASTTSTAGASRSPMRPATCATSATTRRHSVRAAIAIVPQDTVLFNDTHLLQHPLRPPRTRRREEVEQAARAAHIHDFIVGAARRLRDRSRRARPEAVRRREAARRDRARAAEEPGDPDLRRGDLGARLASRRRRSRPSSTASRSAAPRSSSRTGCRR